MKLTIKKKGIVDCTSDPRDYNMEFRDSVDAAIKIFSEEIEEIDYAQFYVSGDSKFAEYIDSDGELTIHNKQTCLKLLNYFKTNPDELTPKHMDILVHIHVKTWKFFDDGNGCSDYINIFSDRLEVSCQDWFDADMREKFHEHIADLIGNDDYAVAVNDNLVSLHINVTEKCKANCDTCYLYKGLGRELEKEDWPNIPVAEQYAIGGGEPAEYPYIGELIDYLKNERKAYVAVTTNGQKIIKFNEQLPDRIAVSIDGLTQLQHNITHDTDIVTANTIARYYKTEGIEVWINHIVHAENINDIKDFLYRYNSYRINLIFFTGKDSLKPGFDQLQKFVEDIRDKDNITLDSCMVGVLHKLGISFNNAQCEQGLYSKYYRFGTLSPCSHSSRPYPHCTVVEDYLLYYFKTLRPVVFLYNRDGTSGAHEWAFKAGYQGRIRHKIDKPLRKDTIYILADEGKSITEDHYVVSFENKMPYWIRHISLGQNQG